MAMDLTESQMLALQEDQAARLAALALESCIVEAPAGAGKTELLTQRFLRLLTTVDSPEEVMAITFTNKAAAEMQKRILDNLRDAAAGVLPDAPHKLQTYELATQVLAASAKNDWHLLEQPSRLRITTIDALCASLARQMPLLSRFGASPTVTDDAGPLYQDAARQTLELLESNVPAFAEPVAAALDYLDNDTGRLTHLLASMLARRDQWLSRVAVEHASDEALAHLVMVELESVRAALPLGWEARLMPVVRFAVETLIVNGKADSTIVALRDWTAALTPTIEDLPRWRGLVDFLFTGKDEWRKSFTVAVGIPAGKEGKAWKDTLAELLAEAVAMPGLESMLGRVRHLPGLDDREAEDAIVAHFAALLKLATANLWQVFRARGETDFVEVAQRALEALGAGNTGSEDDDAPSELALRLDYRIRHLLVDEFQDTSPTQITLLERLTAGWSAGDGRTLFCVGDPMQSIYRFRKADVGLFLRAASAGIGGLPLRRLRLSRNNRSSAPVVEWINAAFAQVFPGRDEVQKGSIAYRDSTPTRPLMDRAGVSVHLLEDGAGEEAEDVGEDTEEGLGREEIDRAEAQQILGLIDATWAADPSRQIAVLVRAKTHLAPLVSEIRMQRPGLPFAAVDVEPLAGRQWIADLLSLCHAIQHRADRVHWLAVLRSPLVGLRLADLHELAGDDARSTVWTLLNQTARQARLSEDGRQRVAVFCRHVAAGFAALGRMPLSRLIEGLWHQLGGPAGLPDRAASRDVEAFFTLLGKLEARSRLTREQLEEDLRRLFATPDPDAADNAQGRLSLMTIHKAKGLEFDTVILPGLHRNVRGNDPEMLLWDEVALPGYSGAQLIVAPMKPAVGGRAASHALPTAYDFLRRLEKERGRNEDLRVLYVAATRAVRALHLVGVLRRKVGGDALPPANTPLADLWSALSGQERQPQTINVAFGDKICDRRESLRGKLTDCADGAKELAAWPDFVPALFRQTLERYVALTPVAAGDSTVLAADGGNTKPRESAGEGKDAVVGTLVHRYLELMAKDGGAWSPEQVDRLHPAINVWLNAQGLPTDEAKSAASRVLVLLKGVLSSECGRWVLAPHEQSLSEAALLEAAGSDRDIGARIAVLDRSFVENGERWIIDYKTTALSAEARVDSESGAAQRQQLAAGHREQLTRYGKLFANEVLPQRHAIFFVDGAWLTELH